MTMRDPQRRLVYVLTAWQERPPSSACPAVWRFSLEHPEAGARRGFRDLMELTAFLETEIERESADCPESKGEKAQR